MSLQTALPVLQQKLSDLLTAAAEFQLLRQLVQTPELTLYVSLVRDDPPLQVTADWPIDVRQALVSGLAEKSQDAVLAAIGALVFEAEDLQQHCLQVIRDAGQEMVP